MKIAIRMDDITPDMNWDNFFQIKDILDRYGIKPLIGVVPFCKDEMLQIQPARSDFWEIIRGVQQEGWSIALHGYEHLYSTKKSGLFPLNNFSEYAGIPYEVQVKMIAEGKEKLEIEGLCTSIFMAPGHTFDRNTVKALLKNGFTTITDGYGNTPYKRNGMIYMPISFLRSRSLKKKKGTTTFVFHFNDMKQEDFESFEKLIQNYRDQFINYSCYMEQTAKSQYFYEYITQYIMAKGKYLLGRIR